MAPLSRLLVSLLAAGSALASPIDVDTEVEAQHGGPGRPVCSPRETKVRKSW